MKIAFFLGALRRGGAESLILDVCRRADTIPFDVCCIYRKEGDYSDDFHGQNIQLIKVAREKGMYRYLVALRKAVLENHIDIVHAQTASNALVSIFALLFTRVRIITTFHGFTFSNASRLYRYLVYWRSRKIICVSNYEKSYYEKKWRLPADNKLDVVYNGVDFSRLDNPVPDSSNLVVTNDETINLIMVGSFRSGRSQFFVCKVANELNKKGIPFNLYFVGRKDNVEYKRYDDCVVYCEKHDLWEKVHFLGNRTDIPYLLKHMDLFVYASEHDTFGIAVLEALAAGLPVVVNDWTVMKEITDNGELAFLYETDNIDDCVSKILEYRLIKEQEYDSFTKRTQEIANAVRERYSIDNHIKELYDIYLSCLE